MLSKADETFFIGTALFLNSSDGRVDRAFASGASLLMWLTLGIAKGQCCG